MEISTEKENTVILKTELDECKNKNGILEQSMKTADNENEILKSEVDLLKVQLQELRTKQAKVQEMEELQLSLMQVKKEMELLRTETKEKLQQFENLEQAQTEVESCKRYASKSRGKSEMLYS